MATSIRLLKSKITNKAFNIWLYLGIVLLFSWPLQFWFAFKATSAFEKYLYSSLTMIMVTIATIICGRLIFKDGFTNAGWHKGKPLHYISVLAFALYLWLIPGLLELKFGLHTPVTQVTGIIIIVHFLFKFAATLIPAFGEEFGWRGYLLPKLAGQYGIKNGLILHAFIWWFWHLPTIIGMGIQTQVISNTPFINAMGLTLISLIPGMLHAVIYAFIWAKSNSVFVASVYHAAFDEVRDTWESLIGFGSWAEIWQMVTIILVGSFLLWKGKWKMVTHPNN